MRDNAKFDVPDQYIIHSDTIIGEPWTPKTVTIAIEVMGGNGWHMFQYENESHAQTNAHRLRKTWGMDATAHFDKVFVRRPVFE